jgi:hypothetical protein
LIAKPLSSDSGPCWHVYVQALPDSPRRPIRPQIRVAPPELSAAGFGKYFGAAYGDLVIGNYMTRRYSQRCFTRTRVTSAAAPGAGRQGSDTLAARPCGRTTIPAPCDSTIRKSSGASLAVAISNAYYADNRTAGDAAAKLGFPIGIDAAGNILKEFWPDLERKPHRRKNEIHGDRRRDLGS